MDRRTRADSTPPGFALAHGKPLFAIESVNVINAERFSTTPKQGGHFAQTLPSRELTLTLLEKFGKRSANSDLIHVAETSFGTLKSKQLATFAMINEFREVTNLKLLANVATGSW